jgi:hypothetical protein
MGDTYAFCGIGLDGTPSIAAPHAWAQTRLKIEAARVATLQA